MLKKPYVTLLDGARVLKNMDKPIGFSTLIFSVFEPIPVVFHNPSAPILSYRYFLIPLKGFLEKLEMGIQGCS
jgi:hypothetical protein